MYHFISYTSFLCKIIDIKNYLEFTFPDLSLEEKIKNNKLIEQSIILAKNKIIKCFENEELNNALFELGVLKGINDYNKIILNNVIMFKNIDKELYHLPENIKKEIFEILYFKSPNCVITHKKLSEKLNISYEELANVLRCFLVSYAIDASRTGLNTFYSLSYNGKKYYEKKYLNIKGDIF